LAEFRPLSEHDLGRLSNEKLIAYANAARAAGERSHWRTAMNLLVFGFIDRVSFWTRKCDSTDHEDLVHEVFERAIKSLSRETAQFEGSTEGEFGAWLRRISQFVVADYHRAREGQPPLDPLASEHDGDEEVFGAEPSSPDHADAVVIRDLVAQALSKVTKPSHRRIVELAGDTDLGFEGMSAAEACKQVKAELDEEISIANAYQINSRFKAQVLKLEQETRKAPNPDA
jgi:RNA polymerase sigma factor (sigma-70 family)